MRCDNVAFYAGSHCCVVTAAQIFPRRPTARAVPTAPEPCRPGYNASNYCYYYYHYYYHGNY